MDARPPVSMSAETEPRPELPPRYNAAAHFIDRHLAEGRGDKIALIDDAGCVSYAGLAERVNRAGNLLRALGVQPEQRVLMLLTDGASFPSVFFGAIKIGAVPVPVNTLLSPADYAEILRDSRARALVVSASLWPRIEPALRDRPPALAHVLVDGDAGPPEHRMGPLLAAQSPSLEPAPTTPDDACFWLYTSGSTGRLKAAVHAHGDLVYTAQNYAVGVLGLREGDRKSVV